MTRRCPMKAEITTDPQTAALWLNAWALDPETLVTIAVERNEFNPVVVTSPAVIAKRFPAYLTMIADDVHAANSNKLSRVPSANNTKL